MPLIDQLSDLLPILLPFEVKEMDKDDVNSQIIIHLRVSESHTPVNHRTHSYYKRDWVHLNQF